MDERCDARPLCKYIKEELLPNKKKYSYQEQIYIKGFDAILKDMDLWYLIGEESDVKIIQGYISKYHNCKECVSITTKNIEIKNDKSIGVMVVAKKNIANWMKEASDICGDNYNIVGSEMINTIDNYLKKDIRK